MKSARMDVVERDQAEQCSAGQDKIEQGKVGQDGVG